MNADPHQAAARPSAAPMKKLPLKSPGKAPAGGKLPAKLPLARPPQQPAASPSPAAAAPASLPPSPPAVAVAATSPQQQVPMGHPSEGMMYDPSSMASPPHQQQQQQQYHGGEHGNGGTVPPQDLGYQQQQQQQQYPQQQGTTMMTQQADPSQQQYQQMMMMTGGNGGGDGTYNLADPNVQLMQQQQQQQQQPQQFQQQPQQPVGYGQQMPPTHQQQFAAPSPPLQQQQQQQQQRNVMDDSFEDDGSPQLNSRTIDVAALPSDSLIRVAEMSRARRARLLADEESWVQEGNFQDKADEYVQHELKIVAADEETARGVVSKQEEKSRDRVQRLYAESLLHLQEDVSRYAEKKKFDAKKEAEIRRLRQEVHRQAFTSFWVQERGNTANMASPDRARKWADDARRHGLPPSQLDKERSMGQVTNCLRIAYENSIPPFVTDPEEAWRRGVTVAPDLQRNGQSSRFMENDEVLKKLNLPSYHEYARNMQERYTEWQANNERAAAMKAQQEYEKEMEAIKAQEAKRKREIERAHAKDFSLHPDHDHEHTSPFQGKNGAAKLGQASPDQRQVAYHMAFPEYYDSPKSQFASTRRSLYQ